VSVLTIVVLYFKSETREVHIGGANAPPPYVFYLRT
jgi:hypothetical protein